LNLTGLNLTGVNLTGVNLTGANLTGANLAGVDLTGVDLTGAILTGVSGQLAAVPSLLPEGYVAANNYLVGPGADLTGANLTGADLTGADLTDADLTSADLTDAILTGVSGQLAASSGVILPFGFIGSPFIIANNYIIGPEVNLSGADLAGANLVEADLFGANLSNADLSGSDARSATLAFANLSGTNLSNADLSNSGLFQADLTNADLSGANLTNVNMEEATLTGVSGQLASAVGTLLSAGYVIANNYIVGAGVNLANADLSGLNLTDANLTGTNLTGANLTGVDLTGAILNGVISGGIIGTPAALPSGWTLVGGVLAGAAQAATLNVVGGQLMGASNVLVDGNLYDVQFLDGNCFDLYNGCAALTGVFPFNARIDGSDADNAEAVRIQNAVSQALLDQVFLDGVEGLFDSDPSLTNGCALSGFCQVATPFESFPAPQVVDYVDAFNWGKRKLNPMFRA